VECSGGVRAGRELISLIGFFDSPSELGADSSNQFFFNGCHFVYFPPVNCSGGRCTLQCVVRLSRQPEASARPPSAQAARITRPPPLACLGGKACPASLPLP